MAFDIAILFLEIYSTDKIAHVHRGIYEVITTELFVLTMIGFKKKKKLMSRSRRLVKYIMAYPRYRKLGGLEKVKRSCSNRDQPTLEYPHRAMSGQEGKVTATPGSLSNAECQSSPLPDSPKPAGEEKPEADPPPLETGPSSTGCITTATVDYRALGAGKRGPEVRGGPNHPWNS